jgi:predicted regulator of Ras-like GTPase activity (Roadblock/LC7/MglB family)
MSELDQLLNQLQSHPGVRHLLLLGRDGLPVRHLGDGSPLEVDTVAALAPGAVTACESFGEAGEQGALVTAALEFSGGVVVLTALSADLLLALVLRPGVGFAALLRDLRQQRGRIASLL